MARATSIGCGIDLAAQPFFVSSAERANVAERFLTDYPGGRAAITQAADAVLRHEFDLLGSGPQPLGTPLPWHTDFKTGRRWPLAYCADIEYNELDRPTDVKVPWELSRCQHFTRLGQAYWLTGDERYAAEFVAETTDWIAANPLCVRRELGLRDGRRAARRQLDLGLLFFRGLAPRVATQRSGAASCAPCFFTASSSSSTSKRPTSTATTTCATASAWCFSAASSSARAAAARWLRGRPRHRRRRDLRADDARTASTSSSRPRITGSCSRCF